MKKTIRISIYLSIMFAVILITNSCKKENKVPTIAIVEPMENDTISLAVSPEVHIEFTASDDEELHYLSVNVHDDMANSFLADTPSVHGNKTFDYHEHIMPSGITNTKRMTLEIKAEDHEELMTTKSVVFYVKP
jgi:hypothetical protein